jgi:quinol monooxygenase YgiN
MSIVAIADMFGISGRRQELVAALADGERDAAGRDGCLRYVFASALAEPDHFVLVSEWRDQAALDAHYASPQFARFQLALNGLLARPSEMTVHSVSVSARPMPSGVMDPRVAD